MLARLILALLLTAFATPSVAIGPCHDVSATHGGHAMAGQNITHTRHDPPAMPVAAHSCIGCMPLTDWDGTPVTTPLPTAAMQPVAPVVMLAPNAAMPPALPPPRIA